MELVKTRCEVSSSAPIHGKDSRDSFLKVLFFSMLFKISLTYILLFFKSKNVPIKECICTVSKEGKIHKMKLREETNSIKINI